MDREVGAMNDFISLFSGAGGLDVGLEAAGWDCVLATDADPVAVRTLEANRGARIGRGAGPSPER